MLAGVAGFNRLAALLSRRVQEFRLGWHLWLVCYHPRLMNDERAALLIAARLL